MIQWQCPYHGFHLVRADTMDEAYERAHEHLRIMQVRSSRSQRAR